MSMSGDDAYVLAMDYVDETLEGGGALKGDDGKSAYQSWLDLGNTGTEEDFINSLKGEKGQVGEKGETGNDGKSSYEIWLDNGNVGTEQDFLDSLKGEGTDGFSPVITENANNTDEDYRLDIETKESKFTTPNLKADIRKNIAEHNTSPDSHNDIRIFLNELNNRLNALANSDDETLDEMKEVVAYIKDNRSLIESITTTKVNVADIIDNLITNVSNKPLSASQGVVIKNLIDTLQSELTAHINNFDIHVTPDEKTNWNNKATKVDLTGQLQKDSYVRSVIALCKTTVAQHFYNSFSNGTLTIARSNGLHPNNASIDLFIASEFYINHGISASITENSFDGGIKAKPCTFSYNGIVYGGIELFLAASNSEYVLFEGETNFKIFGLDYCTMDGTILNEEVYNSINYDNVQFSNKLYHNLKKVYTEGDIEIADVNGLQDITNNNQYTKAHLTSQGWYRIAKYKGSSTNEVRGVFGNSCDIIIKRMFMNHSTEEHRLLLKSRFLVQKFVSISNFSYEGNIINKIRYVYDSTSAYIDIYYNAASENPTAFMINNGRDFSTIYWETVSPYLVDETIEGETVSTVFDIPANANPVTDLDLTIDAIQGLRAELDELRSLITNS